MSIDNLCDVVDKLIGPTRPYGSHEADEERYENILALSDLAAHLVHELREASQYANRPEASMKKIADHAKETLKDLHELCEV